MPSLRTLLFRLHWALGLTLGLVLALVGATGALMSYEEALSAWVDRDRAGVAARAAAPLPPETLLARVEAQRPGRTVAALTLPGAGDASVRARFAPDGAGRRPTSVYVDPYDGAVLGPARWERGFATIRGLHRWLLIPGEGKGWGRTVTGAGALALLAFLATGIILRWPQVHRWRIWLRPGLSRPGRARWWSLHAVAGTWLMPVYLVIALSGLTWSYDWYKDGATRLLTGEATQARPARPAGRTEPKEAEEVKPGKVPPALDRAWAAFRAGEGREAASAILSVPGPDANAIRIRWLAEGAPEKARDESRFDRATGAPLSAERFSDKPLGRQIADSMLEVHRGRFFGAVFAFLFFVAALAMPGFAATGLTLYVLRRRALGRRVGRAPRGLPVATREARS